MKDWFIFEFCASKLSLNANKLKQQGVTNIMLQHARVHINLSATGHRTPIITHCHVIYKDMFNMNIISMKIVLNANYMTCHT